MNPADGATVDRSRRRVLAWLFAAPAGRFFIGLFVFALALRLVNILLLDGDTMFQFGDSKEYLGGAKAWMAKGSLTGFLGGELVLPPERMPGYVWFLSAILSIAGDSLPAIAAVQSAIDSGTCVLIALLGARLTPAAGRLSGILAALWPNLIIHASLVLQDTLFLFLLTAWLLATVHFASRPTLGRAAMGGILFGAAFMVRSVVQFMVPFLPLVLLYLAWRHRALHGTPGRLPIIAAPILFVVVAALPVSPLITRNLVVYRTITPTTQTGLHALYWTVSLVRMDQNGTTFDEEARKIKGKFTARLAQRGIDLGTLNPFERDRLRREMAIEELTSTPLTRLAKVWVQGALVSLFSPSILSDGRVRALDRPSFYETPGKNLPARAWSYLFDDPGWFQAIVLVALLAGLAVSVCQLVGLWQWLRGWPVFGLGMTLFVAYFLAISGPTAGPKYRMPYESVLIILAALGLATFLGWRRGSHTIASGFRTGLAVPDSHPSQARQNGIQP